MCRILLIPGIKKEQSQRVWDFVYSVGDKMSKGNTDGLGFAALTHDGQLFGERWQDNDHAFRTRPGVDKPDETPLVIRETYRGVLEETLITSTKEEVVNYNNFGSFAGNECNTAAITLHTRMATSPKEHRNTHPFFRDGTTLVHNGVISNPEKLGLITSSCDSEAILNGYVDLNVATKMKNMQKLSDALFGYFACGVLAPIAKDVYIMDVFKNSTANLGAVYIKELEVLMITTYVGDVTDTAKEFGYTVTNRFLFPDNNIIRFNPTTGEVINKIKFERLYGYGQNETSRAHWQDWENNKHKNFHSRNKTHTNNTKLIEAASTTIAERNSKEAEEDGWKEINNGHWRKVST